MSLFSMRDIFSKVGTVFPQFEIIQKIPGLDAKEQD